jgi:heme exporter protein D
MTDLSITLSVIAVGVSIISMIFVVITQGFKHTIGFRGSEEARQRKERIENTLAKEVDSEMENFVTCCNSGKTSKQEIKEKIEALGVEVYVSKNLATDILENLTSFMEKGIRLLIVGLIIAILTALVPFYTDLSSDFYIIIFAGYIALAIYAVVRGYQCLHNNYELRRKFILLDENPTIENASEIFDQLTERNLI